MFKFFKDFSLGCTVLIIFLILKLIGKKLSSSLCAFIFMKIGPFSKFNKVAKQNISYVWPNKNKNNIKNILNGMWEI